MEQASNNTKKLDKIFNSETSATKLLGLVSKAIE